MAVYIMQEKGGDAVKIGMATDVDRRRRELDASNPRGVIVLAIMDGTEREESTLHWVFRKHRIKGEWFRMTDKLRELVEDCNKDIVDGFSPYCEPEDKEKFFELMMKKTEKERREHHRRVRSRATNGTNKLGYHPRGA